MTEDQRLDDEGDLTSTRRNTLKIAVGAVTVQTLGATPVAAQAVDRKQWEFETGGEVISSPTVVGGTIFIGSDDNNVYALDTATGDQLWTFKTGGGVWSSPNVVDGTVYVGSRDTMIYALDATTGEQNWAFETEGYVESSPTVASGTVFIGGIDNHIYALDASTGELRWKFKTGDWVDAAPTVVDGTVYIGSKDHKLYALDAMSGEQRWSFETGRQIYSSPTVADDTVFVGSWDENIYALDSVTGDEKWTFETDNNVNESPTVADGTVFFPSEDNHIYALDTTTGSKKWDFETGGSLASPTVAGGNVFVGSSDYYIYSLDAETGDQQWKYKTGGEVDSAPTVVNGTLFIGSSNKAGYGNSDNTVYAIDTDVDGSSEGSRARLGTLGHTDYWAIKSTVDATISIDNVGASAWEATRIEGDAVSAPLNENNPQILLQENKRYLIENNGWLTHPLEIQSTDGTALLSQADNTIGDFEDDSRVNWVDNGGEVAFTLTEALSAEMNSYVCTVHTNAMTGNISNPISNPVKLRNVTLDDNTIAGDGSTHSLSFDVFNLSPDDDPDEFTIQMPEKVDIDSINNIEASNNIDIIEKSDASKPLKFEVDPASPIEDPVTITVDLTLSGNSE